jgi:hypothetical protein
MRRDLVAKLPTGTVDLADICPNMAAGSIRVCPLADPPACPSSSMFPKGAKQFACSGSSPRPSERHVSAGRMQHNPTVRDLRR